MLDPTEIHRKIINDISVAIATPEALVNYVEALAEGLFEFSASLSQLSLDYKNSSVSKKHLSHVLSENAITADVLHTMTYELIHATKNRDDEFALLVLPLLRNAASQIDHLWIMLMSEEKSTAVVH